MFILHQEVLALLRSVEDFAHWLYADCDPDRQRHCYYQLLRLCRQRNLRDHYQAYTFAKPNGGHRTILEPSPPLKRIQRGILRLLSATPLPACATAYRSGYSVRDNALPHAGARLILKLDLRDFFGSVQFVPVYRAIDQALASCDQTGRHLLNAYDRAEDDGHSYNQALSFCFARLCTFGGVLPQGAPTSPLLSNLVFAPIDRLFAHDCDSRGITYTRYSDDLTFSGSFRPYALLGFVRRVLEQNGFALNPAKTALLGTGERRRITGVIINSGSPHADRAYRRAIRQEMHYLQRFSPDEHLLRRLGLEQLPPDEPTRYLRGLLGRIGYVLHLDPANSEFQGYRTICAALLNPDREECL